MQLTCFGHLSKQQQCLLSQVTVQAESKNVKLNAHLLREWFFFVGAACFHRDSPDVLAAFSGNQLQQPGDDKYEPVYAMSRTGVGTCWRVCMWCVHVGVWCGVCPCMHACGCTCVSSVCTNQFTQSVFTCQCLHLERQTSLPCCAS